MKPLGIALALVVAAVSVSPLSPLPPHQGSDARPPAHHDCCCPSCPGPGLCPCDPGNTVACLQTSDDLARDLVLPHALPTLKLVCELPWAPPRPEGGARRDEPERLPHSSVTPDRLDKVPISLA